MFLITILSSSFLTYSPLRLFQRPRHDTLVSKVYFQLQKLIFGCNKSHQSYFSYQPIFFQRVSRLMENFALIPAQLSVPLYQMTVFPKDRQFKMTVNDKHNLNLLKTRFSWPLLLNTTTFHLRFFRYRFNFIAYGWRMRYNLQQLIYIIFLWNSNR